MQSLTASLCDIVNNNGVLKPHKYLAYGTRALNATVPYVIVRKGSEVVVERTKNYDICSCNVEFEVHGRSSSSVRKFASDLRRTLLDRNYLPSCDDGKVSYVYYEDGEDIVEGDGIHSTIEVYRIIIERRKR